MEVPSIPFNIIALAPFRTQEQTPWKESPLRIDKNSFDQIMESLDPSISLLLPKTLYPEEKFSLSFKRLRDFHPDRIIENHPWLHNLLEAKKFAEEAHRKGLSQNEIEGRLKAWPDLPFEYRFESERKEKEISTPLDEILSKVAFPEEKDRAPAGIKAFIAQIESYLRQILRSIFLDKSFRGLESTWRGLRCLLQQGGADGELRIGIVPISNETFEETLEPLMTHLLEELPSLVLIDLPMDNAPRNMEILERVAQFSESLMTPTLFWFTEKFLYLDSWDDLKRLPYLPHYLEEPLFAKWRRLRGLTSSKWLVGTCVRFLLRYPYGPENPTTLIPFEESEPLWISPVWGLGTLVAQSFSKAGWPTLFTQWQEIRLTDLALQRVEKERMIPTEVDLNDERIGQFIRAGIMPLVSSVNRDIAFFPGERTVAGTSLKYQLFLSRMVHFLLWCKDHIEKDLAPELLEERIKKGFILFWEKSGHPVPKDFEISVRNLPAEKSAMVKLTIQPPREILPSGERVELELPW